MKAPLVPKSFYQSDDVCQIAKGLLGKVLVTNIRNQRTSGIITETEAYCGLTDRACHAWLNKKTARTEVLFEAGGIAYVYLCYGIHQLFNIVTGPKDIPQAVLIRAIEPFEGEAVILKRRNQKKVNPLLLNGPGKLSQGLGIQGGWNRHSLVLKEKVWLEDHKILMDHIQSSPRIGIEYAGEDAKLPWRFTGEVVK